MKQSSIKTPPLRPCSEASPDAFQKALQKALSESRSLLCHCRKLSASVSGRLTVSSKEGRPVFTHCGTDGAGQRFSRRLGRNEDLLKQRIKAARAADRLIPLLEKRIRLLEQTADRYEAFDLAELLDSMPSAYRQIPLDLQIFCPRD